MLIHYGANQNSDDDDDDNDEDEDDDDEAEEDEEDADGNEDEQADDDDDDDDDELPTGRSTLTSQTARQHVFPILVAELVRENIIGKKEGSSIMDQFNSGNPVVRYFDNARKLSNTNRSKIIIIKIITLFFHVKQCSAGCV